MTLAQVIWYTYAAGMPVFGMLSLKYYRRKQRDFDDEDNKGASLLIAIFWPVLFCAMMLVVLLLIAFLLLEFAEWVWSKMPWTRSKRPSASTRSSTSP